MAASGLTRGRCRNAKFHAPKRRVRRGWEAYAVGFGRPQIVGPDLHRSELDAGAETGQRMLGAGVAFTCVDKGDTRMAIRYEVMIQASRRPENLAKDQRQHAQ